MKNPFSDFPQPELEEKPSVPVQPSASSVQVPPSACPPSHSSPSRLQPPLMHKNRLQEFTQRSSIPLPVYQTFNEGSVHAPKFRSSVKVDGIWYTSGSTFSHRKAAEQDVAKYALECISKKLKDEGCPLIREDTIFCKSILNEFVVKMNLGMPTYNTIQSEGLLPLFVSTLVFNGMTYHGEPGRNKKEAEQLAARAAILSLLADARYGTSLSEIIKSKEKLYVALNKVKDSSISNLGTTPSGANTLIHNNKEKETSTVSNCMPTIASPQPSSGAEHPRHAFKIPKSGQSPECIDLPIVFVPAITGQASDSGESSSREHLICVPTSASPQPSSGAEQRRHEFKIPKSEQSPECIDPPIAFVPAITGQASDVGQSTSRKRRRKKKRAKLDTNTKLAAVGIPFNQDHTMFTVSMNPCQ